MPYYNMTALADNVTGIDTMVLQTNALTEGLFGVGFGMTVGAILFLSFYGRTGDAARSMSAALFLMWVLLALEWVLGWVSGLVLWIPVVLSAISIAFVWRSR